MSLTRIFLRALKHPDADAFDVTGPGQLQSLVLWLENTKIRHYPPNERAQLQSPDQAEWRAALERYLDDVACPLPKASRSETSLVDWLLSYAGER